MAQYEGTLLDKREFVIKYLDKTFHRLNGIYGTIGEVSGMFPDSTLIISTPGHLTCSKQKILYDTFDPRNKEVEYVWLVK